MKHLLEISMIFYHHTFEIWGLNMQREYKDKILLLWTSLCTSYYTVENMYLQQMKQEELAKVTNKKNLIKFKLQTTGDYHITNSFLSMHDNLTSSFAFFKINLPCFTCDQHEEADLCTHYIKLCADNCKIEEPEV